MKRKNKLYDSKEFRLTNFEWTDYMDFKKTEKISNVFKEVIRIREVLQNCDKNNINSISVEIYNPTKEVIVLACGLFSHWVITYVFENKKNKKIYLLYRNCSNTEGSLKLYNVIPDEVMNTLDDIGIVE